MPKITIDLSIEKIDRLKEYLSWIEKQGNSMNSDFSDYWMYHADKIDINFSNNSVFLTGESGFYFPRKINLVNRVKNFARLFPTRLSECIFKAYRNILPSLNESLSTYPSAYEKIWSIDSKMEKGPLSQRIELNTLENEVLNFRNIKGMKEKWWASKTQILSEETIKHYFHLQLVEGSIKNLRGSTVCEIGSGTGNLASLFYYHFNAKLFLVDLWRLFHIWV